MRCTLFSWVAFTTSITIRLSSWSLEIFSSSFLVTVDQKNHYIASNSIYHIKWLSVFISAQRGQKISPKNAELLTIRRMWTAYFVWIIVIKIICKKILMFILICSAIFSIILLNANRLNHSYYSYLIAAFMRKIFNKRQDFQAEIRRKHIEEKFSQVRRMSDLDFTTPNDIARHMQLP